MQLQQAADKLQTLGFSQEDARRIARHLDDAEKRGKSSHGYAVIERIEYFTRRGDINTDSAAMKIVVEDESHLIVDAHQVTGFIAIEQALEKAIEHASGTATYSCAVRNHAFHSGMIGYYARKAAKENLIFISAAGSGAVTVPHGGAEPLWGTNPLTISIPAREGPVVLDMASTKTTFGDVKNLLKEGKPLDEGLAIDGEGKPTTNPEKALEGGLLPIAEHKGSGLAFVLELLSWTLTGTKKSAEQGPKSRGFFFTLINPAAFRPIEDFLDGVSSEILRLKHAKLQPGVQELLYPGEHSQTVRSRHP